MKIPHIKAHQSLTEYADQIASSYIHISDPNKRKNEGQYFTPPEVASFMSVELLKNNHKNSIKILDPAAGIGIFLCAVCELLKKIKFIQEVSFDLYEKDPQLIKALRKVASTCKKNLKNYGIQLSYKVFNSDFIQDFVKKSNKSFSKKLYDFVIANPPYYKLSKKSFPYSHELFVATGIPNIYILFMAIGISMLEHEGKFVFLTPRSFFSGFYFKKFRNWFFKSISLEKIHSFISRKEIFKREGVLQELLITIGKKEFFSKEIIEISCSFGIPEPSIVARPVNIKNVIVDHNEDYIINIPESNNDEEILKIFRSFGNRFSSNGYLISTGPVVPFRTKDLVDEMNDSNSSVPLLWMENIKNGRITWPLLNSGKPIGIILNRNTKKLLVENSNYVFIKRFSSKEEKKRVIASYYSREDLPYNYLGIENHVNYIYLKDNILSIIEARGIAYFLNSVLYNRYFHLSNGNTQINASEIMNSYFPNRDVIQLIGDQVKDNCSEGQKEVKILELLGLHHVLISSLLPPK